MLLTHSMLRLCVHAQQSKPPLSIGWSNIAGTVTSSSLGLRSRTRWLESLTWTELLTSWTQTSRLNRRKYQERLKFIMRGTFCYRNGSVSAAELAALTKLNKNTAEKAIKKAKLSEWKENITFLTFSYSPTKTMMVTLIEENFTEWSTQTGSKNPREREET